MNFKTLLKLLTLILIGIIIFVIWHNNSKNIKNIFKIYYNNYKIEKIVKKDNKKLLKLQKKIIKQKQLTYIKPEIINFFKKRYLFKYNDYYAYKLKLHKIYDTIQNKYFYELTLYFYTNKSGTLLSIIELFYKEKFIKKIYLVNKHQLKMYIDIDNFKKIYEKEKNGNKN